MHVAVGKILIGIFVSQSLERLVGRIFVAGITGLIGAPATLRAGGQLSLVLNEHVLMLCLEVDRQLIASDKREHAQTGYEDSQAYKPMSHSFHNFSFRNR